MDDTRGKGSLAGWKGSLELTTDTFEIAQFLKTDGPTNVIDRANLENAIVIGGTFGDYRGVESNNPERPMLFVMGPNSILYLEKAKKAELLWAIKETFG
jgi:hypothetical protein